MEREKKRQFKLIKIQIEPEKRLKRSTIGYLFH